MKSNHLLLSLEGMRCCLRASNEPKACESTSLSDSTWLCWPI